MTDKELGRLKRVDLLELLLAQGRENQQLKEQVAQLQRQLEDRRIDLAESGTLAEAALRLNQVFQAADAAAQQYLENVRRLAQRSEGQDPPPETAAEQPPEEHPEQNGEPEQKKHEKKG